MRLRFGNRIYFFLLLIAFTVSNCKKTVTVPPDPEKAVLTSPSSNSLYSGGKALSTSQMSVTFTWTVSQYTSDYEVSIKNLFTGDVITQSSAANQTVVNLQRNVPYAWFVTSKSKVVATTVQSDTWRFYVSGEGVKNYPPFPALLNQAVIIATSNTSPTVNLSWTGSSVDHNISGYDVFFGTAATPPSYKGDIKDMSLNKVPVASGNTYYWEVITKDSQGNISDSGVSQFKVN